MFPAEYSLRILIHSIWYICFIVKVRCSIFMYVTPLWERLSLMIRADDGLLSDDIIRTGITWPGIWAHTHAHKATQPLHNYKEMAFFLYCMFYKFAYYAKQLAADSNGWLCFVYFQIYTCCIVNLCCASRLHLRDPWDQAHGLCVANAIRYQICFVYVSIVYFQLAWFFTLDLTLGYLYFKPRKCRSIWHFFTYFWKGGLFSMQIRNLTEGLSM